MRFLFFYFLLLLPVTSFGAKPSPKETGTIVYYGKEYFLIEGTDVPEGLKESPYDRLPLSLKRVVRPPVWDLSKNSAGLSVRFWSNTSSINVKWKLLLNKYMNHMAETGIKGLDLYVKIPGNQWQYINTARPTGIQNEFPLVNNMTPEMREYKIYLPLYDGLENLEIGIDSLATIKKPAPEKGKPIIFYGTSITQGGCASRPGMAYSNIISRKLGIECINYGFSANGRMEKPIVDLIAGTDALLYVIDCSPNMSATEIEHNAIPLAETIQSKRPGTPIVFVENQLYDKSFLDTSLKRELIHKNKVLKRMVETLWQKGYTHIYYVEGAGALGTDHEGTVDGIHFTDLGFMRYSDYLIKKFREYKVLTRPH